MTLVVCKNIDSKKLGQTYRWRIFDYLSFSKYFMQKIWNRDDVDTKQVLFYRKFVEAIRFKKI